MITSLIDDDDDDDGVRYSLRTRTISKTGAVTSDTSTGAKSTAELSMPSTSSTGRRMTLVGSTAPAPPRPVPFPQRSVLPPDDGGDQLVEEEHEIERRPAADSSDEPYAYTDPRSLLPGRHYPHADRGEPVTRKYEEVRRAEKSHQAGQEWMAGPRRDRQIF